jgi:transcriptional regulator with XRE-family HTH domain
MDLYIERIKPLLESSGMTDKDIEEALNLPRGVIYKWGIGKNKSYKRFIPEIAKYFNVSADYLMGLDSPSAGIKKERPADGEALIRDLPEDIQQIIRICMNRPELASALLNLAKQIEKD